MLVLTFQAGADRLALDIRHIREVVPRVELAAPAGGPPALAGTFVYRGQAVPVLDLHRLLGAGECPPHLSSRIILVQWGGHLVGLLAAQVADLKEIPPACEAPALPLHAGLGQAVVEGGTILHLLDLDRLLAPSLRLALPGGEPG